EDFLQIAFGQRPSPEPRRGSLRARTHATLAIDAQAFGDVAAQAEQLHRHAVLHDDGDRGFEPALLALRSPRQAVLEATWLVRLQGFADRREDTCGVLRRQVLRCDRERALESILLAAVKGFEVGRPNHLMGPKIP